MKKYLAAILCAMLLLTGCAQTQPQDDRLQVVTTIFPAYDFAREIAKENISLTLLLPPGSEVHSWEPTPQNIISIQKADVLICNGGESESFIDTLLADLPQDLTIIKMTELVTLLEEEHPEEDAHEEHAHEGHSHDEIEQMDEHVWTDPANVEKIVTAISETLAQKDSENAESYLANAKEYTEKLHTLDKEIRSVTENAVRTTLVFGDRFPLRYFAKAYQLDYYAAFAGCSTDTEPSSATVAFLIDTVKEESIPVVFCTELSNGQLADAICEATGAKKLTFESCQNVTKEQLQANESYLSLMQKNVEVLKEALW